MHRPLSFLSTVILITTIGLLFGFIWNEGGIRLLVLIATPLTSFHVPGGLLLGSVQAGAGLLTLLSGIVAAYIACKVASYFEMVRSREVASVSAILWGAALYFEEMSTLPSTILSIYQPTFKGAEASVGHPLGTVFIFLIVVRYFIDIVSVVLFWYVLKRKLLSGNSK